MAQGIINIQTDLTSLKYTTTPLGSDNPYVVKSIDNPPSSNQVVLEITKRIDDTSRIAKMLIDKPGIKYLLHEAQLQQINAGEKIRKAQQGGKTLVGAVLQQIGNTVVNTLKIAASTLAQIPVNGTGTHFIKGFRTDTYLQPENGNEASAFAQFFGAGGVEGAQYALRGEEVPGVHETELRGRSSKYDYVNGKVFTNRNETPNQPIPDDGLSQYKAEQGLPVVVGAKKPVIFGEEPTQEAGDLSPTIRRAVQTTITPGGNFPQNSIKSIPNRVAPEDWTSPDSISNVLETPYSYDNTYTGYPARFSTLYAQEGIDIPVVPAKDDPGLDRLNDGTQNYDEYNTYTGFTTTDNINSALGGHKLHIDKERKNYRITNADKRTDGINLKIEETVNTETDAAITLSGDTAGQKSIPSPISLKKLERQINSGSIQAVSRDGGNITYTPQLQDFRSGSDTSYSFKYGLPTIHKEKRVGLGDQGAPSPKTNYSYVDNDKIDKLNEQDISNNRVAGVKTNDVRDLAKLFFEIITPSETKFLYFRAFIDSVDDSYNANWESHKYVGRAEDFYTYGGFSRDINISFKIAAATRSEMKPLYRKMVYLASTTAPTYGGQGFMRGTLAKLTVGSYFDQLPGVITSVKYSLIQDMPWEIAMQQPEVNEAKVQELPMGLQCSISFKPIHDFAPQTGLYHYFTSNEADKNYLG